MRKIYEIKEDIKNLSENLDIMWIIAFNESEFKKKYEKALSDRGLTKDDDIICVAHGGYMLRSAYEEYAEASKVLKAELRDAMLNTENRAQLKREFYKGMVNLEWDYDYDQEPSKVFVEVGLNKDDTENTYLMDVFEEAEKEYFN